jgi:cellulose synthase (UDP-forming)
MHDTIGELRTQFDAGGIATLPSDPGMGRRAVNKATGESFLISLMTGKERAVYGVIATLWVSSVAAFWLWWLRPAHNIDNIRFLINSVLLFWTTVIPGYFFLIFSLSRVPNKAVNLPTELRVAMVVTKAPSEPFDVVRRTLAAMLAQDYPHDTWLADEDPSDETLRWCARHNVAVSTRKNVPHYHNETWPRRKKCKEGNLAYFYDTYGYERYDIVVQMDADHVPGEGYLTEMVRPFADPRVGYVSAPSICDSNATESWSARGRLYLEGALHGPLQAGYTGGLAPLCIGSHYAVRTKALKEIGGLGPELAEDHSTSLIMNSGGWRGVHAFDAIAHGEGPATFPDLAVQEFQWSRSLVTILLRYTKRYIGPLPLRLKIEFLFAQLWYPLFAIAMLATILLPAIALLTRSAGVNVTYGAFFVRATLVELCVMLFWYWMRRKGWFRPANVKFISWESAVFVFARWPWALFGTVAAIANCVTGRDAGFRVTPKSGDAKSPLPAFFLWPYIFISILCGLPALLVNDADNAKGFYAFSLVNSIVYLLIPIIIVVAHDREQNGRVLARLAALRQWALATAKLSAVAAAFLIKQNGRVLTRLAALRQWALATVKLSAVAAAFLITILATGYHGVLGANALLWHEDLNNTMTGPPELPKNLSFGAYDPSHAFADLKDSIAIEHIFVSWLDQDQSAIKSACDYARQRNRWLMITVEPWADDRPNGAATLLKDICAGSYDREISTVSAAVAALDAPVFIRWGHEMETPTGRYPWATHDSTTYIAAYRHFVDACHRRIHRAYYVWSPRGAPGLENFFPGRSYVDYVAVSLYARSGRPSPTSGTTGLFSQGERTSDFQEWFGEVYRRVKRFNLPVMIAEMGVEGTASRQWAWLSDAVHSSQQFPLLRDIIYFNAKDTPGAWPGEHVPDWTIPESLAPRRRPSGVNGVGSGS